MRLVFTFLSFLFTSNRMTCCLFSYSGLFSVQQSSTFRIGGGNCRFASCCSFQARCCSTWCRLQSTTSYAVVVLLVCSSLASMIKTCACYERDQLTYCPQNNFCLATTLTLVHIRNDVRRSCRSPVTHCSPTSGKSA